MSALHYDGFDQYDAIADLTNYGKWAVAVGTISTVVRKGSGKSVQFGTANSAVIHDFAADQAGNTLFAGIAVRRDGNISVNVTTQARLFAVHKTVHTSPTTPQFEICVDTNYKLCLLVGASVVATGTSTLIDGVYYYITIDFLVANSGTVLVKLNGTTEINYSGDTQYQSTNAVTLVEVGCRSSYNFPCYVDDFYIFNNQGTINNTSPGPQRIELLSPSSDVSSTLTRSGGANDYSNIDDLLGAPDDASTYLIGATGQKGIYGLSNLQANAAAVAAVKVITRAQADDVGALSFKHGVKSGATEQQFTYALGVGYANYTDIIETSDGASTVWSETTINSLSSSIEVI